MTKTATLALLRIEAIEEANRVIACQKGRIARANNRQREGKLVPKEIAETPDLLVEFHRGWDSVDVALKDAAEAE
jgi:hypothetical protein